MLNRRNFLLLGAAVAATGGTVGAGALTEAKEDVSVEPTDDGYRVSQGDTEMTYDTGAFVAGVFGRAAPGPLTSGGSELLALSD